MWQQAGRAGRAQRESLVVFVARDDPLDHYLAHHPRAVFGRPIEATVTDRPTPTCSARSCAAPPPSCR
jgi:DEAD/DEAH box helicase domain-containing protein